MSSRSLSPVERKVLVGARFSARESISTLAKRIGVRAHVAQRALQSLRQRGIITQYVAVNVFKLGLVDYAVFFSISPESAKAHRKLMQFLVDSPEVPWIAEFAGEYSYAFSLICGHVSQVDDFLLALGKAVNVEMTSRTVVTRTSWTVFPPRYLLTEPSPARAGYEVHSSPEVVKHDALDIEILRQLSGPKGPTDAECARALGEASTTVRYRRSVLEQKGVILSYCYAMDVGALGRFPCVFLVQVKTPSIELRRRLQAFAASDPEATCLISCIGAWDYEVSVDAASPSGIADFQRRLLDRFSKEIVAVRSLATLKTLKLEPFPSGVLGAP